jgi:hypothetical protein
MVILVKIVKIGQLQMDVESRGPIMHSGFFRLKHSVNTLNKKNFIWKVSAGGYPLKKILSDHDDIVTRDAGAGRVHTIKIIFSQNHIENLILIILGHFRLIKSQKNDQK